MRLHDEFIIDGKSARVVFFCDQPDTGLCDIEYNNYRFRLPVVFVEKLVGAAKAEEREAEYRQDYGDGTWLEVCEERESVQEIATALLPFFYPDVTRGPAVKSWVQAAKLLVPLVKDGEDRRWLERMIALGEGK